MPDLNFSNPQGQSLTVSSPDGSVPSEQELDTMFSQKYGSPIEDKNEFENIGDSPASTSSNNPNSTGDQVKDIVGDLARGALNSGAGTVDKINGAVKLLKNTTAIDLGSDQLTNVSNQLKDMASKQPQSSNPVVSGIGQFVGSVPDALAEFAGTGGGVGFIARSAALQAAQEYNKTQSPIDLAKGAAMGGTIGAVLDKTPELIEGFGNIAQKWGQTAGKKYLQAVTGATDKEIDEIMDKLPTMDTNAKSKVEDFAETKNKMMSDLDTLKDNNSNLIKQQKDQNTKIYNDAKSKSDDAVNNLIEDNRDAIENFKSLQTQRREDLVDSTSSDMMAATDAGVQKLADTTAQTTSNSVNAKKSLDNTLVNIFSTASKKAEVLEKGAANDVANAHASLENNGLDYVPTQIIAKELDGAIGTGFGKYYTKLLREENSIDTLGAEKFLNKEVSPGVKVSDLPPEAQVQYRQQVIRQGQSNIGKIARSGNTPSSLTAAPGIKNGSVMSAIKLINDTRKGLVDEFSRSGRTSLVAMDSQSDALENAINKGFFGKGVPEGLANIMSRIKQAINPTKLFDKYPKELEHLQPLAEANKAYSSHIDNLRNALNLYKDNVDGAVNPQKVFNALDRGDSSYLAKLKQADEALPKEDRIFDKVQDAYNNYRRVESSEKMTLSRTEKEVSAQRVALSKKFSDMRRKLNSEQRQELSQKLKESRMSNRSFKQQEIQKLRHLHSKQEEALSIMQAQKDKELQTLHESINSRLNSLHLLHMVRGSRASATGTARIFQNVAEYRSIDGLTTLNPLKMIQGKVLSKFAAPMGAANIVKDAINMPNSLKGLQKASGNVVLKRLLANKLSGR